MKVLRLPFFCFGLLLFATGAGAQVFGGNPPSLKWRQLNTDTARIIFPKGLDSPAQEVAAIVHLLSRTTLMTIGHSQRKIDIVLQNQTTIANGYVGLAPFRSEFQLTPEQNSFDLGSLPWEKMLAIHEYRHVQQYNNFRVGLSGAFYYLFGEGGQAFANSLSVPNWFWEGDAVYQETLVSDQGRGRLPYFFNPYRSLWAGGKDYSWMKLRNGSFRDYVPNWYPLGYMLVSYGRERYGDKFWRNVTHDAASFHGLFYPLQGAIRRYAGMSFQQFRTDAFDHFRKTALDGQSAAAGVQSSMPAEIAGRPDIPVEADSFARAHRHFAADEEYPQFLGRDTLLYMRSSYKRIPAFVIRDLKNGRETRVRNRAISLDNFFSVSAGRVVYAAYETDPRWGWRDYSVIRVLDPYTGEDRRLTSRSRYFSPDISADGRQIVTVREAADGSCSLVLLDAATGAVTRSLPNTDKFFYTYPKFYGSDPVIITPVRTRAGKMALVGVNAGDGAIRYLLPASFQTIGFPSVRGDSVWFTASRDKEDRIYCLTSGQLFRVILPHGDPSTGQYQFNAGGDGQYTWNTFTSVGYWLDHARREAIRLEREPAGDWPRDLPVQGIDSLEHGPSRLLDTIPPGHYPESSYPIGSHLINFHSWRPYINDPDYQLSLVSDNILNTLDADIFAAYNRNEQYTQVGADATYGALYPFLDAGWNYTFNRNALYRRSLVYWNETNVHGGFNIPLFWTRHLSYTSLQFGSDLVYSQRYYSGAYKDSFNTRGFAYANPFVFFSHQSQQSHQQIAPRWAQVLTLSYSSAITAFTARQFLASGYLYLPGLAYTHSVVLGGAFQQRDTLNNARFTNSFPFSRGYAGENFYRMWRWSVNYQLPLFYPDWGFGNILYLLRVRANLYYDHTRATDFFTSGQTYNGTFRSFGSEVYFDTKWWNQLSLSFGIRYSRLLDPDFEGRGPNQWELILPLNILSQGYSGRAVRPTD
jgi:hypothetical protein